MELDLDNVMERVRAASLRCPVLRAASEMAVRGVPLETAMAGAALVLSQQREALAVEVVAMRSGAVVGTGEVHDAWTERERARCASLAAALPEPQGALVRLLLRRVHRLEGELNDSRRQQA